MMMMMTLGVIDYDTEKILSKIAMLNLHHYKN